MGLVYSFFITLPFPLSSLLNTLTSYFLHSSLFENNPLPTFTDESFFL